MKFDYFKFPLEVSSSFFGASILKPIIPVELSTDKISFDIARHGYGILGQKGFFDLFAVNFDLTKEEIGLKPR